MHVFWTSAILPLNLVFFGHMYRLVDELKPPLTFMVRIHVVLELPG